MNFLTRLPARASAFLLGLLLATTAQAGPVSLSLTPISSTVDQGSSFTLQLSAASLIDLYAHQFSLNFDPSVIHITAVREGTALPSVGSNFFIEGDIDNVAGRLGFAGDTLIGPIAGFSGDGILASIDFIAVGAGFSSLVFSDLLLLDSSFNELEFEAQSARVSVAASGVLPEPAGLMLPALALALLLSRRRR